MQCYTQLHQEPLPNAMLHTKRNLIQKEQGTNTPNCCAVMIVDPSTKRDLSR